jgi:hypothetical protein
MGRPYAHVRRHALTATTVKPPSNSSRRTDQGLRPLSGATHPE